MFSENDLLNLIAEITYDEFIKEMNRIGLEDSRIINQVDVSVSGETINVNLPEYAKWIELGRRPLSQNPRARKPPIGAIREQLERKGISEQFLYQIRNKIHRDGIRPRPFINEALFNTNTEFERELSLYILNNLDTNIKQVGTNTYKF